MTPDWKIQTEYDKIVEAEIIGHNCTDNLLKYSVYIARNIMPLGDEHFETTSESCDMSNPNLMTQHADYNSPKPPEVATLQIK